MSQVLSHQQLREIAQIVEGYYHALAFNILGPDFLDPDVVDNLVAQGIVDPETAANYPELVYLFGRLSEQIEDERGEDVLGMPLDEFLQYLQENPPSISLEQRATIGALGREFEHDMSKLSDKVVSDVKRIVLDHEADFRRKVKIARQKMVVGIEKRQTGEQIGREIERATGDYASGWMKIAATRVNNSMLEGRADEIRLKFGPDARVFKRPRPDACKFCVALYLESDGKTPRIFRLSDMESLGTNIGLSKQQWKAVVGAVHPWCSCSMHHLPADFGFDIEGDMVLLYGTGLGTINP